MGSALECGWHTYIVTPSLRTYHLQAAFWCGSGLCAHFPSSELGFCQVVLGQVCAPYQSEIYVYFLLCLENDAPLKSSTPLALTTFLPLPLHP